MKTILLLFVICLAAGWIYLTQASNKLGSNQEPHNTSIPVKQALNIDVVQDASASIGTNGVELPTSDVFQPYFEATDRDIQLRFNCIGSNSAQQPLSLILPAFASASPIAPNLSNKNVLEKRKLKQQYVAEREQFALDSTAFFLDRRVRCARFCQSVDSVLSLYRTNLARSSDVATAIRIADDALFYDQFKNARHLILLNSDGEDSQGRTIDHLEHTRELYLINASGKRQSSLEPVVSKRFVSLSDAITYSLTQ